MTAIIGFNCQDGTVIAADSEETYTDNRTYLVSVIDCCTREIVSWNLSHRCRTEEALDAVEQAVLQRLPQGRAGERDPGRLLRVLISRYRKK